MISNDSDGHGAPLQFFFRDFIDVGDARGRDGGFGAILQLRGAFAE
jgi:hypothetical protein